MATSSVLALVIAHELGHVLLPFPAHKSTGIMQPFWHTHSAGQVDQRQAFFSAQQGALIRGRLAPCSASR